MNRRQKSALRSSHIKLADQLILDEDFYAALRQNKIFTDSMIAIIKAEKKPRDRVYKMLELLEKRGPKAFDNFVWILKENYEWLADMLEREYEKREQAAQYEKVVAQPRQPQYEYYQLEQTSRQEQYRVYSMPTLSPRSCQMIQMQVPFSPSCVDGSRPHFFPYRPPVHNQQFAQHESFCDMDCLTVNVCPPGNTTVDGADTKKYKDACMSPIGIIESPKKVSLSGSQAENKSEELATESKSDDQGFHEIASETVNKQAVNSDPFEDCKNEEGDCDQDDAIDGLENVKIGIDGEEKGLQVDEDEDDAFPSSEVYYEHVRRGSSCLPESEKELLLSLSASAKHAENSSEAEKEAGDDDFEDDMTRTDSSLQHHQEYIALLEDMKTLYFKLVAINSRNENIEVTGENVVTMDMIDNEVEKLLTQLHDSDDSKMVKKCYALFSEKERRLPLNMCIENIMMEKKEIQDRLCEKRKEIDQMVYDMWNHQQDMKHIEKLKKTKNDLLEENAKLKRNTDELKISLDQQRLHVVQKELKIQDLENKIRDLEEKNKNQRRSVQPQRRMNNTTQMPPTRRQNPTSTSNLADPRMAFVQNPYSASQLQSPRTNGVVQRKNPVPRR